jgi:hypothetical protein
VKRFLLSAALLTLTLTSAAQKTGTAARPDESGTAAGILLGALALYFVPTVGACIRKLKNTTGLVLLNLFLGWTVIGWIVALIWAASGETESEARAKQIDYAKLSAAMQSAHPPPPPPQA